MTTAILIFFPFSSATTEKTHHKLSQQLCETVRRDNHCQSLIRTNLEECLFLEWGGVWSLLSVINAPKKNLSKQITLSLNTLVKGWEGWTLFVDWEKFTILLVIPVVFVSSLIWPAVIQRKLWSNICLDWIRNLLTTLLKHSVLIDSNWNSDCFLQN